jgi:hypothetical protein
VRPALAPPAIPIPPIRTFAVQKRLRPRYTRSRSVIGVTYIPVFFPYHPPPIASPVGEVGSSGNFTPIASPVGEVGSSGNFTPIASPVGEVTTN